MNMREQIAVLTQQVEDLKAKVIQQDIEFSQTCEDYGLRIKELKSDHIEELARVAAEHKKALDSKQSNLEYSQRQRDELQQQLNSLQDVLDVIPGVIPREKETSYGGTTAVSAVVRLASVLASKFQ